jgi:ubiquinone/menaquinone biosynthesis C-methylase UbiE
VACITFEAKSYYIYRERYDWLMDTKNFERLYHMFRSRIFLKKLFKIAGLSWILDAGCGTGLITVHVPQPVIGVDINLWNLRKLQKRLKDKELIQADIENLPFRGNCLGLIICTEVLEHLPLPDKAIGEFYRILKDNGILIGTVPSIHPIWRFRKYLLTTCPVSEPFHKNYTRKELKNMLKIFQVRRISYFLLGLNLFFECRKFCKEEITGEITS